MAANDVTGNPNFTGNVTFNGEVKTDDITDVAGTGAPDHSQGLKSNGVDFNPPEDSEIFLKGGSGHGSIDNKIRRFTTADIDVGTAFTLTQSAFDGDIITIDEAGVYSMSYTDGSTGGADGWGITLNSSELTTAITGLTNEDDALATNAASANTIGNLSLTRKFAAGDIIRCHTEGSNDQTSTFRCRFRITQILKLA